MLGEYMKNAIILDDEILAIERMERLLENDGRVQVVGKFQDAFKAIDYCMRSDIDIIFTDIEMPTLNGITFGKMLQENSPNSLLVYMTAHSQYTLEAFENNAVGYLLKPIIPEKLTRLLDILLNIKSASYDKSDHLVVKTLGNSSFKRGDRILTFRTKKAEELFCYLLHQQGKWTTADGILDALWPEKDLKITKKQLHTTVYYCRKALQSVGMENLIEYQLGKYRLNIEKIEWDYQLLYSKINEYLDKPISKDEYLEIVELNKGYYFGSYSYQWAFDVQYQLDAISQQFYELQRNNNNIPQCILNISNNDNENIL